MKLKRAYSPGEVLNMKITPVMNLPGIGKPR